MAKKRKVAKKPVSRKVDPCGYKVESVTSLALSLYCREEGATDKEVIDRCTEWFASHGEPDRVGKSQRVFVLNPKSERDDRTLEGRGHVGYVDRGMKPCRYFAQLNLDAISPFAIVPNYFPSVIRTTEGTITKSDLAALLHERAKEAKKAAA